MLKPSINMRLTADLPTFAIDNITEFSKWILRVGDGNEGPPNDGEGVVEVPDEFLIKDSIDPIAAIVNSTYPELLQKMHDIEYMQCRAILAPTNVVVDSINDYMLDVVPGEERIYLSSDSICKTDMNSFSNEDLHSPEFLNSIKCSGVPNFELKLKVGVLVMLLRNIDQTAGLCNGTKLVLTKVGNHVLEGKVISGSCIGERVFISRMLLTPSDTKLSFKFQRRQFPICLSFAMTINKSQGQTLSNVGLFLRKPVFSHDQLYVAISRVKDKRGLKFLILDKEGQITSLANNVVFKEVFQNLA